MKKKIVGKILILFITMIWGLGFVFQAEAAESKSTFLFIAYRMTLAALFLTPALFIFKEKEEEKKHRKALLVGGITTGIFLYFAANLQQLAMHNYPEGVQLAGRSAFLTSLYVIVVPIIQLFITKKIKVVAIIGTPIVLVGLYLLSFKGASLSSIYAGDLIFLSVAILFALHVISINYFSANVNPIKYSAIQFITAATLSILTALFSGGFNHIVELKTYMWPALYLGLISSGIAYTLQVIAQKWSNNPGIDTLIMSLESIFGALAGMIFCNEVLQRDEIIGCAIIFIGIIIAILPVKQEIKLTLFGGKNDGQKEE